MTEIKLLSDPMTGPEDEVLEDALKNNYKLFREFAGKAGEKNLTLEWHYYLDGKSWLCKVLNKKKNLCWLSVWNTGFKLTFYFMERALAGFYELDISDDIKKTAAETKSTGKFLPVMLLVKNKKIMNDALKLLDYKKKLK